MNGEYGEGEVMSREDRLRDAYDTISELGQVTERGDSFDIGFGTDQSQDSISNFLSNPSQLANQLNLSHKQSENIAALITGGVAGAGRKWLSRYIGPELAGAVSGFLGGVISKKIVGR